ncbi:hypothetical protein XENOCAPTIV_025189 [Xenoophorus captivus]|uniref:Uncharacterized protein n=1 Tax=Xenoophorus captivus TaxID=1517983 RepID=A0ABV0Q640_9TELE
MDLKSVEQVSSAGYRFPERPKDTRPATSRSRTDRRTRDPGGKADAGNAYWKNPAKQDEVWKDLLSEDECGNETLCRLTGNCQIVTISTDVKRSSFGTMQSDTLLHIANFSTLLVCMVLKFPQIFVLMRAKCSTGISLNSLLLELIG